MLAQLALHPGGLRPQAHRRRQRLPGGGSLHRHRVEHAQQGAPCPGRGPCSSELLVRGSAALALPASERIAHVAAAGAATAMGFGLLHWLIRIDVQL